MSSKKRPPRSRSTRALCFLRSLQVACANHRLQQLPKCPAELPALATLRRHIAAPRQLPHCPLWGPPVPGPAPLHDNANTLRPLSPRYPRLKSCDALQPACHARHQHAQQPPHSARAQRGAPACSSRNTRASVLAPRPDLVVEAV